MMKTLQKILTFAIILVLLTQCDSEQILVEGTVKFSKTDPFKKTISESQYFTLDANVDNVVEGKNGTIIVLPKGCLKNSESEIVTTEIKLELAEALSMEEMVLSNLTTTSNGKPLITDGMIFVNATQNGNQLIVNKTNPIHIEIPTHNRKAGMMAYKGVRDEFGNMDWIEPRELKRYLVPIDLNLLDFLPEGFEEEVTGRSAFSKYRDASQGVIDSLYYSLSAEMERRVIFDDEDNDGGHAHGENRMFCGVDPAAIKVIRGQAYQNTLLSTREFEERLQVIFNTCQDGILEIYVKNTDKNLWELDSLAMDKAGDLMQSHNFEMFYKQKLTNVKDANEYTKLLGAYYEQQIGIVRSQLKATRKILIKKLEKEEKIYAETKQRYKELLKKREKYRMETYGFEMTDLGWVNIDIGRVPKDWSSQSLEMFVEDGKDYDRVHTYVIMTSNKSLAKLQTKDQELFHVGNDDLQEMIMPNDETAIAVCVAYSGSNAFLAIKGFEIGEKQRIDLILERSSIELIREAIKPLDNVGKENRLSVDLQFMKALHKLETKKRETSSLRRFLNKLAIFVRPCCTAL